MLLFMASLASAKLLVSRSFVTELPAVDEALTVRYQIANTGDSQIYNVTLHDPTFSRHHFRFVEGKTQALLTYGELIPGQPKHVDLELVPKLDSNYTLKPIQANYTLADQSIHTLTFGEDQGTFFVISQTDFRLRNVWQPHEAAFLAVFFLLAAVVPLSYSAYLRRTRFAKLKLKTN
mmetsp:Transcript_30304/g.53565  ORF Transcript_30304/g.53565 Transcript_30304/m.53565 type:complete len:177 (-) Transcript_30304:83-613(-)